MAPSSNLWPSSGEKSRNCDGRPIIQGCLFGSFSALWTILALQLDARYHLSAEIAGLFGIVGAVGVLFAPVAGKIADRRGPPIVIGLGSVIMLASWVVFEVWGMIVGLIVGVICWTSASRVRWSRTDTSFMRFARRRVTG
jgi:nitrate/nitrite transporter NarK